MKRFLINLSIFLLPLTLLLIPPCAVLYRTGENLHTVDDELTSGDKYLIGYAYNEDNYAYLKWKALTKKKSRVVALGSSRVLQFRDRMFDAPFYNAGFTIEGVGDFVPFLESIPDAQLPEFLIVGLDQWMFNAQWDNLKTTHAPSYWSEGFRKNPDAGILKNVWSDLLKRKYGLLPDTEDTLKRIGLNAVVRNTGFRNDGSMQYGSQIGMLLRDDHGANDYGFKDTYTRIDRGNRRFQHGEVTNLAAVEAIDRLLSFCKQKGIYVVAFLPPFADGVQARMQASGKFGYMNGIHAGLRPGFDKYGFECYDFSAVSQVGSDDREMVDGFHGGELTYAKLLVKMLDAGSKLNGVTDVARLRRDIERPVSRYTVYTY
jgi:hypothetical protein